MCGEARAWVDGAAFPAAAAVRRQRSARQRVSYSYEACVLVRLRASVRARVIYATQRTDSTQRLGLWNTAAFFSSVLCATYFCISEDRKSSASTGDGGVLRLGDVSRETSRWWARGSAACPGAVARPTARPPPRRRRCRRERAAVRAEDRAAAEAARAATRRSAVADRRRAPVSPRPPRTCRTSPRRIPNCWWTIATTTNRRASSH